MFGKTIIINKLSWKKNSSQRKDSFLSSYSNTSIPPTQFFKKIPFEVRKSLTPTTRRTLDVKRLSITLPTHTSEIRQKNLKENVLFKNWKGEWTWRSLQDKPRASWSVQHCVAGSSSQERTRSSNIDWGSLNKCKAPIHWPELFLPTELLSNIQDLNQS